MTDSTVLVLGGVGVPPYSARGLQQTLEPIGAAANAQRTINGTLIDLSADQFQKYQSTITGNDQQPPAVAGVWPGKTVIVDCIAELCYETPSDSTGPEREVVASRTEGDFTFYRPRLTMLVTGFSMTRDEWGAVISWTMQLEEV